MVLQPPFEGKKSTYRDDWSGIYSYPKNTLIFRGGRVGISYTQLKYEEFRKRTENIVAFYQEYSRYLYLYFTTGK